MRSYSVPTNSELEITDLAEEGIVQVHIACPVVDDQIVGDIFLRDNRPLGEMFLNRDTKFLSTSEPWVLTQSDIRPGNTLVTGGHVTALSPTGCRLWFQWADGVKLNIPLSAANPLDPVAQIFTVEPVVIPYRPGEAITLTGDNVSTADLMLTNIVQQKWSSIAMEIHGPKLFVKNSNDRDILVFITQKPLLKKDMAV